MPIEDNGAELSSPLGETRNERILLLPSFTGWILLIVTLGGHPSQTSLGSAFGDLLIQLID